MLKGKRVLTDNFFGTVLNDAERENVLILQVIRERIVQHNNRDVFDRMVGMSPVYIRWVVTNRIVAVPWAISGVANVCRLLPKKLHASRLKKER